MDVPWPSRLSLPQPKVYSSPSVVITAVELLHRQETEKEMEEYEMQDTLRKQRGSRRYEELQEETYYSE